MSPVLVLLLQLVQLNSESTSTPSLNPNRTNSTGLEFSFAFPENIAFFHPEKPDNQVRITALYDDTEVTIGTSGHKTGTVTLQAGQIYEHRPGANLELRRFDTSNRTLQITSTKLVIVHVTNRKRTSLQTVLVTPADQLGMDYLIPPLPLFESTKHPVVKINSAGPERGPFQLIIINRDQVNNITVDGVESRTMSLQPHQTAQIWIQQGDKLRALKAERPVAVLFGHTCAPRQNCSCGQLLTALPPTNLEERKFYIPPALASDAEAETFVLLSEKDSSRIMLFSPKSPVVQTSGSVLLYRPGLLLAVIPETDFASCSVVNSIPGAQNFAVIMTHKDHTDGVHIGGGPLDSPNWRQLEGTDYVSTTATLTSDKNVIWHASSTMAVYYMGKKNGALFGNPAAIVSRTPDFRGCLLSPEVVEIRDVAGGWRESLKLCRDNSMDLVSFPRASLQKHIYDKILQTKSWSLEKAWIGMRRSAKTGEWYWLNQDPVSDMDWGQGEPGTVHDGQCAVMSVQSNKDFIWSDEDCCKDIRPVCYMEPVFFPLEIPPDEEAPPKQTVHRRNVRA